MSRLRRIVGALCVVWLTATPAVAQEVEILGSGAPRNALVIGNGDYSATRDLPNASGDAALIAETLKRLDFKVTELNDATQAEFSQSLLDFANSLPPGGIALVFFAGHGVQWQGENYLIPVDANPGELRDLPLLSVSSSLLLSLFADRGTVANIFIFDACRNNPFETAANRTFGDRTEIRGLAPTKVRFTGNLIAYSTAPGEVSTDGKPGEHSPYAKALSESLLRPGLSIESVFKLTRTLVIGETKHAQIPWENSSLVRDIYLLPGENAKVVKPTECDLEAGHPSDPMRLTAGVPYRLLRPAVAIRACRAALVEDPDNPRLQTELARALLKAGDYQEALELNYRAAEQGYVAAFHNIGNHYKQGSGVPRDLDAALEWFLKAAEQGHPEDEYNSGVIYSEGTDTMPPDYELAHLWLERAAKQDYPSAFDRLGLLYREGKGVPRDDAKANEYFERGAELGDASAMVNLATSYRQGVGTEVDYGLALELFRRAAQLRRSSAYTNLGDMYRLGEGLPADNREAAFWYGLAARTGHRYSQERFEEMLNTLDPRDREQMGERIQQWIDSDFG